VERSIEACRAAQSVGEVVVAVPPGEERRVAALGVLAAGGGGHRSESVLAALELVEAEIAVVHDAARPLVEPDLIDEVVARVRGDESLAGAVAATPVTDTLKEVDQGRIVSRTLDRSALWAVQTPQAFRLEQLRAALEAGDLEGATDDAMLVERRGGRIAVVPAPAENLKVTTRVDLRLAELLLAGRRGPGA
jgi:2-C-methyl-D-erythritol 4-phosphate cytidylyltransferase